ncbi:MAG: hypothetical protein ABIS08_09290 [Pseudolysinimonas sp.]
MAEFDGLDELLSGSLKRSAQPGDSAGVADTIRARVAAGDPGTPAPSGNAAPGFGSGVGSWLPWLGLLVVGAIVGGALGLTGVAGHPVLHETSANQGILIALSVPGRACPGGPVVAELTPGSRVIALARSEDGLSVQVRNPADTRSEVWILASKMETNSGQPAFSTLPVGTACPTVSVPLPVAAPPVVAPLAPGKPGKPVPPAPDTSPPVIGAITVNNADNCKPIVTAQISDNVGVSSATLTGTSGSPWNFNQTIAMSHVGGTTWKATLTMPSGFVGIVNLSITAHDAAGNTTAGGSKFTDTPGCPIG